MSTVFITDGEAPLGVLLANHFSAIGFRVKTHPANGDVESIRTAIGSTNDIEILINNAEPPVDRLAFEDIDEETISSMIDCVARTAFFAVQAAQPIMGCNGGGKIINISSSAPIRGMLGGAHYSVAKGSLYSFTRSWSQELAPDNIRVNLVSTDVGTGTAAGEGGIPPFGRAVRYSDIVTTVDFLAGHGGDMISGQEIIVDAGLTKGSF